MRENFKEKRGKTRTNMLGGKMHMHMNMLWGEEKNAKKEGFWKIFGKIGEILEKLEGISEDFTVKKKRF